MKTTRRRNERKAGRSYTLGRGLQQENRRKSSKKLRRGERGWEKKIQRQGGKCRGEEIDGNKQGDEEGDWTCIGSRGETMIDYGIANEGAWEKVEEFRIGE
jgi:hypothetical protein